MILTDIKTIELFFTEIKKIDDSLKLKFNYTNDIEIYTKVDLKDWINHKITDFEMIYLDDVIEGLLDNKLSIYITNKNDKTRETT